MRLFSLRALPGGVTALTLLLFPGFSDSSPTGLVARADTNTTETICFWDRPQTTIFRDTIYIDGGYMRRLITQDGDSNTKVEINGTGLLYSVNLTHSFSIEDDQFSILGTEKKPSGNVGTDFSDGFMMANDYEFIIYGGYLQYAQKDVSIDQKWSLSRYMLQNGATPLFNPGEFQLLGLDGVTRYIASGGSVNVPSENKAFVFSGATGPTWGEFYWPKTAPLAYLPYGNSSNLISVDLSIMGSEKWSNNTFPSSIPARKSAELAWIPVGAQGMLVAFGGSVNRVRYPYRTDVTDESKTKGQEFVDSVHLYDIASAQWYTQKTFGETLPPTSEFCTVVATSSDNKTHQIYAYGGHEDISNNPFYMKPVSANVYVLSIPSFTWTKVYDGTGQNHARKGHRCHKVADNQMMVIGGRPETNSDDCLKGGLIRIFNLNTLEWEDKYDPSVYDAYKVPAVLQKVIGGNEDGGGTLEAETWNDGDIKDLFDVPYTKTIPTYWPYPSASSTKTGIPSATIFTPTAGASSSNSMPSYVPPLLGAILGLLGLITILCAVLFWLRRKKQQRRGPQSDSAASTVRKNRQTWSWLLGVYGDEKRGFDDPTPSTEGPNPFDSSGFASPMPGSSHNHIDAVAAVEAQSRQVYEMPDSSQPPELPSSPMNTKKVKIDDEVTEMGGEPKPRPEDFSSLQDNTTSASASRREEARHERGLDPQALQRLLDDPDANLHDD